MPNYVNPGAAASEAILNLLAQREAEKRQAMIDEIARQDRDRRMAREDTNAERQDIVFRQGQEDRAAAIKAAEAAHEREGVQASLMAQRQASLNAGEGDPMAARATRDAINVALRMAGGGAQADAAQKADDSAESDRRKQAAIDAYLANPTEEGARSLKLRFGIEAPKAERDPLADYEARKRIDSKFDRPASSPQPQIFVGEDGKPRAIVFQNGAAHEIALPAGIAGRTSEKPHSEGQLNAAGFADRMSDNERIVSQHEKIAATTGSRLQRALPGELQDSSWQEYQAARDNWINAQLRRESGAAISQAEYESADRQYFPQPGDSASVIEQKRARRATAEASMRRSAGSAATSSATGTTPAKVGRFEIITVK